MKKKLLCSILMIMTFVLMSACSDNGKKKQLSPFEIKKEKITLEKKKLELELESKTAEIDKVAKERLSYTASVLDQSPNPSKELEREILLKNDNYIKKIIKLKHEQIEIVGKLENNSNEMSSLYRMEFVSIYNETAKNYKNTKLGLLKNLKTLKTGLAEINN